jgi:hypothetical protein
MKNAVFWDVAPCILFTTMSITSVGQKNWLLLPILSFFTLIYSALRTRDNHVFKSPVDSSKLFTFTFTFIFISGSNHFPVGMDIKHVTYYRFKMTIHHSPINPINNIIRPLTDSSSCQNKTHGSWKNLKQIHALPLHIHWQAVSLKQLQL